MLKNSINSKDIITYTRSDKPEEEECFKSKFAAKKVIVATNLAGRGTDIQLDNAVKSNGGLHVCVTFLPRNLRVEQQAFGRAARQGQQGSAQLILDYSFKKEKLCLKVKYDRERTKMSDLVELSNKYESNILQVIAKNEIISKEIKDELFDKSLHKPNTN